MPEFRRRQVGFSLLEVGLAITLALILSAALATFYNQIKDDAGDTLCRNRIAAFQGVVEALAANNGGVLPTLDQVRLAWRARRPDDFDLSPWGGRIFYSGNTFAVSGGDARGITPTDPARQTLIVNDACTQCVGYSQESNFGAGTLYYYRVVDAAGLPNSALQTSMWDQSRRQQVVVTGYGIASIKSTNKFFMVTSGR